MHWAISPTSSRISVGIRIWSCGILYWRAVLCFVRCLEQPGLYPLDGNNTALPHSELWQLRKWFYIYEKGFELVGITNLDKRPENLAYSYRCNTLACTRLPVYLLLCCYGFFFLFFLATYSLMSKTNITCVLYQILETPIQFDQLNVFLYFTVIKFTASLCKKNFVLRKIKKSLVLWYTKIPA